MPRSTFLLGAFTKCRTKKLMSVATMVVYLLLLLIFTCFANASSHAYELQRRFGHDGNWTAIASFTLTRKNVQSPVRLSVQNAPVLELSSEQRNELVKADYLFYRVMPTSSKSSLSDKTTSHKKDNNNNNNSNDNAVAANKNDNKDNNSKITEQEAITIVSLTPCSIIRGFSAVDSQTVMLTERFKLLTGQGSSLIGLQVSSQTNFFHAKMRNGDECDKSIVHKLFPSVRTQAEVQLLRPIEPTRVVKYEELRYFNKNVEQEEESKPQKKMKIKRVKNEQGEWVEKEVPVEETTFLQKYGLYIAIFVGMTVLRSFNK